MGLFMGFSVISLAEMLYFLVLKPISELIAWRRKDKTDEIKIDKKAFPYQDNIWHTKELYPKGIKGWSPANNEYFKQNKKKMAFK